MVKLKLIAAILTAGVFAHCAAQERPLLNDPVHDVEIVTSPAADPAAIWSPGADGVIAVAGKPPGYIATRASYTNYRLHVEWRWTGKPGNGGVLLHIASGPKDKVWPLSQQVQTKHGNVGDLLPMAGATFNEPLSTAPGAYPPIKARVAPDSEKPAGEWNSMDVTCRDGVIDVIINGVAQNHVSGSKPASGPIGFQLEGAPYQLRNLRIDPFQQHIP
ncbi:MAG TPA: DUF1080 domain-containing protein [Telluria sp.]